MLLKILFLSLSLPGTGFAAETQVVPAADVPDYAVCGEAIPQDIGLERLCALKIKRPDAENMLIDLERDINLSERQLQRISKLLSDLEYDFDRNYSDFEKYVRKESLIEDKLKAKNYSGKKLNKYTEDKEKAHAAAVKSVERMKNISCRFNSYIKDELDEYQSRRFDEMLRKKELYTVPPSVVPAPGRETVRKSSAAAQAQPVSSDTSVSVKTQSKYKSARKKTQKKYSSKKTVQAVKKNAAAVPAAVSVSTASAAASEEQPAAVK